MHGAYIMRLHGGQVCFVLLLAMSCIVARPSDSAIEARDLHSSPGFKFVSTPKQWGYLTSTYIPRGYTTAFQPVRVWTNNNNHLTHYHHPSFSVAPVTHASNLYMVFNGRLTAPKTLVKDFRPKEVHTKSPFSLQPIQNFVDGNFAHRPLAYQNAHAFHHYMVKNILESANDFKIPNAQPVPTINKIEPITPKVTNVLPKVSLTVAGNTYETIATTANSKDVHHFKKSSGSPYDTIATPGALSKDDAEHIKIVKQTIQTVQMNGGVGEGNKPTSLVLKPVAKAVAGAKGVAIAAPLSRAVVKKGQEVNIHFDPLAVAVVGPGGVADAHSDLVISYLEDLTTPKSDKA